MINQPKLLIGSYSAAIEYINNFIPNYIQENHPDKLICDENLNTENIRAFRKFMMNLPILNKEKIGIIFNFQNIHKIGKNTLLKLLENPPKTSKIIIAASYIPDITITSRCDIIHLSDSNHNVQFYKIYRKIYEECMKKFDESPNLSIINTLNKWNFIAKVMEFLKNNSIDEETALKMIYFDNKI